MNRFLVITLRNPEFPEDVVEPHFKFLKDLDSRNLIFLGGPFADRSGGAYVLNVNTIEEAKAIAYQDPVHLRGASTLHLYEWVTGEFLWTGI